MEKIYFNDDLIAVLSQLKFQFLHDRAIIAFSLKVKVRMIFLVHKNKCNLFN